MNDIRTSGNLALRDALEATGDAAPDAHEAYEAHHPQLSLVVDNARAEAANLDETGCFDIVAETAAPEIETAEEGLAALQRRIALYRETHNEALGGVYGAYKKSPWTDGMGW